MNPIASDVRVAQKDGQKLNSIIRNRRLGRYQGRNSASTDRVFDEALARRERAIRRLTDAGCRELAGLLVAERELACRLSEARDNGQHRPELQARLTTTRRSIREALAE